MRSRLYVHICFETEHYNFGDDVAKALAASVEISLEDNRKAYDQLIGQGHDVNVYAVEIIEEVQTGSFRKEVPK